MRLCASVTVLIALTGTMRLSLLAPWTPGITERVGLVLFKTPDCVCCSKLYSDMREAAPMLVMNLLGFDGGLVLNRLEDGDYGLTPIPPRTS